MPERLLCSWFGAGWMKPAPGTWGSAAALPLGWLLWWIGGTPALAIATALVFALGWWASERIVRADGLEDPSWVVIDEVAGQWLTLLLTPPSLLDYAVGFALFRLFDIWKPWPVSWADQKIKGGLGIMLDDILAGLMALAVLSLLQWARLA
ncbi:MAG TPA: phosphatidylglycerophosphatase A [Magnetospirillaceae bacterium]|nr:phosphatidylglycerophosphatase A [Magnetospirillaceae bacterium]